MAGSLIELYPTHSAAECAAVLGVGIKTVYNKAAALGLKKSREWIADHARRKTADPAHGSHAARFKPGHATWNKGTHFTAGGRSADTRFKPGHRPHGWKSIGHERFTADGVWQRKVTNTGVTRRDYVNVHWIVWREAGRDIPPGHALVFKDSNRMNVALDNLELVTRAELMRRNSLHRYPKEIALVIQLRGAINRQINRHTRPEAA